MSTTTGTRGRPKAATKAATTQAAKPEAQKAQAPQPKKEEKNVLSYNFKQPARIPKIYTLNKKGGMTFMLNQSGVTVYDEERNQVREIRYCPKEPSIFVDEQSQVAKKEAIIFRDGDLYVPVEKPNLMKFLDVHPENVANGGNLFKVLDKTHDAEKELDQEYAVFDAVAIVRERPIDDLIPVCMFYGINTDRPVSDIKYDMLKIAKSKPSEFIKSFDDPVVKTKAIIKKAASYQVLKLSESGCYWFDSGSLIVSVPAGKDPEDVLTRFCLTENGASVLSSIQDHLVNT